MPSQESSVVPDQLAPFLHYRDASASMQAHCEHLAAWFSQFVNCCEELLERKTALDMLGTMSESTDRQTWLDRFLYITIYDSDERSNWTAAECRNWLLVLAAPAGRDFTDDQRCRYAASAAATVLRMTDKIDALDPPFAEVDGSESPVVAECVNDLTSLLNGLRDAATNLLSAVPDGVAADA